MSQQSLYGDYSFTLNSNTATLVIQTTGHNSYQNSGSGAWQLCHYFDGNLLNSIGGSGAATETPVLVSIARNVSAGSHTLRTTWSGVSNIIFSGDTTLVMANFK